MIFIILITFSGPPANFCSGKPDGAFSNPADQSEYFYCISGKSSSCQACTGAKVFQSECGQCLPIGTSKYLENHELNRYLLWH